MPRAVLDALQANVPVVRAARRAWDADPPLTELARHGLHCMVVSGGHHPAFDAVCEPFNALLLRFWREVDRTPPPDDYIPLT